MTKINNTKPNRLINEKSPYLLQHAYNPVDWYPWGDEAFQDAKKFDKPIFLSIGYSTCHWCHVMAHESFEDKEVAELMNETFINIKVDREERPDIDSIYMDVYQILNGSGGWPLTIIMTPEQKPFFAATYLPKESVYGRIGMLDLTARIQELWKNKREEILSSAKALTKKLISVNNQNKPSEILPNIIERTYEKLFMSYDEEYGGFGNSPKFPIPHNLKFLSKYFKFSGKTESKKMIENTLIKMAMGGIFDHIGYGFHRYSTDRSWLLPHFEKMLYDQAHLISAYLDYYQISNDIFYKEISDKIIEYLSRTMLSGNNALYSAEDADSDGEEGKFYVWTYDEIRNILAPNDFELFKEYYNIKKDGNYQDEISADQSGKNILHITEPLENICKKLNIKLEDAKKSIEKSLDLLFQIREKRIHPHKDDKILCDWNSMVISALSKSYKVTKNKKHLELAINTINFIEKNFIGNDFRLNHLYKDGEISITATADDYAYLIRAYLDLYEVTFNVHFLRQANELQKHFLAHFWDNKSYGFFMTADYSENLIVRKKDFYDGAIPSSNSIAFENLYDLWEYTANVDFRNYYNSLIEAFANNVNQMPSGYTYFMSSYLKSKMTSSEIVIVCERLDDAAQYFDYINSKNLKGSVYTIVKTAGNEKQLSEVADFTEQYSMIDNKITVYICQNFNCSLPINDFEKFKNSIDSLFE